MLTQWLDSNFHLIKLSQHITFLNLVHADMPIDGPLVQPDLDRDIQQMGTLSDKVIAKLPIVSL